MIDKIKNRVYQFLRKTQKYTGTDNVYLAKGGSWLILGQAISMLANFLLALAFANLLTPATYGNYNYVLSVFAMLGILSLIGMGSALEQAVARSLEGSFYTGFKTKLKYGFLGSLLAVGGAIYYWLQGNDILPIPLLISAVFLPLMNASQLYTSFLGGKKLFSVQTKYGMINQTVSAVIMVTALFFTKNLFWLVAVYLVGRTLLNYSFYLITKIKFKPNKKEDPQTISYGFHISLMGVISQTATYLDRILLFTFIGPAQLAVYSFAALAPEQIQNALGNINLLALPKLAPKSREEIRKNIMNKFWKFVFLTGIIAILYVVIAPYLYKIFFPQYLASIAYSQILAFSLLTVPVSLLGTTFQAKMMKKELYLIKIAPFFKIALLAALIPFYGIWGAITAVIGEQIFKTILVLSLFRKF